MVQIGEPDMDEEQQEFLEELLTQTTPEYIYCEWCEDTRPISHKCYSVPANLNFYYEPGTGEDD